MENGDWGRLCNTSKIIYSYLYKWRCRHNKMARVNISILGVSELKWTGMGEFNSDEHYIYHCGQESLRRNRVSPIVNKRVWNALLGCSLKNNRKISVHFKGKTFYITVIPAYAPTSSAEVAEVERFYEDIQDLLELTHKKDVLSITSSVQSLSHLQLFVTPWIAAHQASLSITNSRSLSKLMSIELVMPSSHLILCCPLLLLPPIPPSIRVFSNESALCMRWPKYWSFSFSISPSNEHPGLICFKLGWTGWISLQSKGLFSNTTVQKH